MKSTSLDALESLQNLLSKDSTSTLHQRVSVVGKCLADPNAWYDSNNHEIIDPLKKFIGSFQNEKKGNDLENWKNGISENHKKHSRLITPLLLGFCEERFYKGMQSSSQSLKADEAYSLAKSLSGYEPSVNTYMRILSYHVNKGEESLKAIQKNPDLALWLNGIFKNHPEFIKNNTSNVLAPEVAKIASSEAVNVLQALCANWDQLNSNSQKEIQNYFTFHLENPKEKWPRVLSTHVVKNNYMDSVLLTIVETLCDKNGLPQTKAYLQKVGKELIQNGFDYQYKESIKKQNIVERLASVKKLKPALAILESWILHGQLASPKATQNQKKVRI